MGLMRQIGLIVHNLVKPVKDQPDGARIEKSRKVEEEQIDENVTLRRTTIEEIEIKSGGKPEEDKAEDKDAKHD